jgi:hypothetical protein
MVTSAATTVAQYLEALPADRRAAISKVRAVVKNNLPRGFLEQYAKAQAGRPKQR